MVSKKDLLEKCNLLGIKVSQASSKEKILELIQDKEKVNTVVYGTPEDPEVKHIYHISDIHIRYIERHPEYLSIFEKLYENLRTDPNLKNTIMVIGGDIFHTRDKLVSETLILFDLFIKNITKYVKVFMILGNHDCFNHSDRMDTISGIINITSYENLFVMKYSGIYEYSNVQFGVSSLLDGKFTQSSLLNQNKIKIGLYHGIISNCITDSGLAMTSDMSLDKFSGYDLVMLGDVHKRQYLNDCKTIAYPGSLIQQNFKEERKHGYLKWDLSNFSSEFICLENDWSFIDIPIGIDLNTINFSKFSRVRLILDRDQLEQDIKDFTVDLEKHTTVLSIKNYLKEVPLEKVDQEQVDNIANVDVKEQEIITQLLKNKEDSISDILNIHNRLSNEIEDQDFNFKESLPWTIDQIQFRNIFSYGGDILNIIDLKDGITGILASNASGKTNILNTIMYGLFGNIYTRTQNQNNRNIVSRHAKKQDLFVRLKIRFFTGKIYYIERSAKQRSRTKVSSGKGQQLMTETLNFYREEECLNLSTKPDTEKLLRETLSFIGKEEFILTNMMSNISYGLNMSIISMSGSQLDEIFSSMFNLNKYKLLHAEAKKQVKLLGDDIKINSAKISVFQESINDIDINKTNDRIKTLQKETLGKKEKIQKLEDDLEKLEKILLNMKTVDVEEDEKTITEKIKANEECLAEYTDENGSISGLLDNEDTIENEFNNYKKIYNEGNYKKLTSIEKPNKINMSLEEIQNKISYNEGKKQKIDFTSDITNEYMKAKKFMNSIKNEDSLDLDKIKGLINNMEEKEGYYLLDAVSREIILDDLSKHYFDPSIVLKNKKIIEDKEKRDRDIDMNIHIDEKINEYKKMLKNRTIQEAHDLKEKLNEYSLLLEYIDIYRETEELMEKLHILEDNSEMNDVISKKILLLSSIRHLRDLLNDEEKELFYHENKRQDYDKLISQKERIIPEISRNEHDVALYKTYVEITHPKNLPKIIISNVIRGICKEANKLIYNTTGLLCEIEENEKWEIVVKKDNLSIGPEHCSGYERFVINTCLKLSFDKYKQLSSIKLFLIDEVIDCVSEDNFDQIDMIFEYLQEHYKKIIIISHNEELKKKVNQRIDIKVNGKISSITH